jgi:iron complex transport system substrate-binding protein
MMMIARRLTAPLVAVLFGLCPPAGATPVTVTDASGRTITINDTGRVVSIGGAITEILYALGRGDRIVAVDTTSVHPPQALKEHPNVGYQRQLSPEGVLGMRPSLVLAVEGAGPKEAVAVLERAGVPFVLVPDRHTGEGVLDRIKLVAKAMDAGERGDCLAGAVKADLDALARLRSGVATPARVLFVLSMAGDRLLVAGGNTAADGIIRLAGAVNAITGYDGYKAVTDEAIIGARPDAILVMQRSGQHAITADSLFAHPAFRMTPAANRNALIAFDGLYLLGFGPRTAAAARDLALRLYPQLAQEPNTRSETSGAGGCRD